MRYKWNNQMLNQIKHLNKCECLVQLSSDFSYEQSNHYEE